MKDLQPPKSGRSFKERRHVPVRRSRSNKGPVPKGSQGTGRGFQSLGLELVELPIAIFTTPQADFPHCHCCLEELTILSADGEQPRRVMCPKSLFLGKSVAVPSDRAQTCTQRAAPLTVEEQRAFFGLEP